MLATGLASFAQEADRMEKQRLSPKQRNQLRLKQMTLDLDLSAAQQKEMAKVIAEQSANREKLIAERKSSKEARKEFSKDEQFAQRKAMLDQKIAMKARVKQILTPEQYAKWESRKGHKAVAKEKRMKMKHNARKMEKK